MKNLTILVIALLVSTTAFSQKSHHLMGKEKSRDIPQNEVKLNLGTAVFGLYPEITYERILSEDFSLGASAGVSLDKNEYPLTFGFMPYARWFFGGNSKSLQKYGAGFFIEANGALFSRDDVFTDSDFGAGLGLAIGWKYLTSNNWVGEIFSGAGRDFVNDNGYPRVGITIGKRF